jgi:proteasome lid subunit RPN8/RPN11
LFIFVFRFYRSVKVIKHWCIGRCMAKSVTVSLSAELLDAIFEGARRLYPRETILLLRGKKSKDSVEVRELVVPPLATHGHGFANIPLYMLPMDFSIVGTVHSHPSGNIMPSDADVNHFFGRVLMIVGFPFMDERNVAVYNSHGEKLSLLITKG